MYISKEKIQVKGRNNVDATWFRLQMVYSEAMSRYKFFITEKHTG